MPSDDLLQGTPYAAIELIGEGGMGEVYLVRHRQLGTEMVVKLLRAEFAARSQSVDRLRLEAQALGALNHPNIVKVSSFGRTERGQAYLVMERLRGRTLLAELRQRGRPPLSQSLADAQEVLLGLGAAHAAGLVHRDVKPSNVFAHLTSAGERQIKLLDFGVAKVVNAARRGLEPLAAPTVPGTTIGTPRFMSPEQASGAPVDARADLYSLGLLLFLLVAGRGPWDEVRNEARLIAAHLSEPPPPPSKFAPDPVPAILDRVILKALEKKPELRYQSAAEFAQALTRVQETMLRPPSWFSRPPTSENRAPDVSLEDAVTQLAPERLQSGRATVDGASLVFQAQSPLPSAPVRERSKFRAAICVSLFVAGVAIVAVVVVGAL